MRQPTQLRQIDGKHYDFYSKGRSKTDAGNQITSLRDYISKAEMTHG